MFILPLLDGVMLLVPLGLLDHMVRIVSSPAAVWYPMADCIDIDEFRQEVVGKDS